VSRLRPSVDHELSRAAGRHLATKLRHMLRSGQGRDDACRNERYLEAERAIWALTPPYGSYYAPTTEWTITAKYLELMVEWRIRELSR